MSPKNAVSPGELLLLPWSHLCTNQMQDIRDTPAFAPVPEAPWPRIHHQTPSLPEAVGPSASFSPYNFSGIHSTHSYDPISPHNPSGTYLAQDCDPALEPFAPSVPPSLPETVYSIGSAPFGYTSGIHSTYDAPDFLMSSESSTTQPAPSDYS